MLSTHEGGGEIDLFFPIYSGSGNLREERLSADPYPSVPIGFAPTCNKQSIFHGWATFLSFHAEYGPANPASTGKPAPDGLA